MIFPNREWHTDNDQRRSTIDAIRLFSIRFKNKRKHAMLKRILFIGLFSLTSLSTISLANAFCRDAISRESRDANMPANAYSKQIRMAPQRAAQIYLHEVSGREPKSTR